MATSSLQTVPEPKRPRRSRFAPPEDVPFEFTPPARQEIRNNNIPLTIGLLLSIVAAFMVFIISLAGSAAGADPIMPSFWRAVGALAVFTTLSFAASWFMPAPTDHRKLLNQIEAEEEALAERYPKATAEPRPEPKGRSIDVTVDDTPDELAPKDELALAEDDTDELDDENDDFDDDEEEDVLAALPGRP